MTRLLAAARQAGRVAAWAVLGLLVLVALRGAWWQVVLAGVVYGGLFAWARATSS